MTDPRPYPKYQRIFDQLRSEIDSGKFRAGQRMPSEADLAKRFDVSRITVGRALKDLQNQGLVERRAGSGTYARESAGTGKSFGLLIPDLGRTEIFEPICRGMCETPQAHRHMLLWQHSMPRNADAPRQEQASQICRQYTDRKVAGVFFAPFESLGQSDQTNELIVASLDEAGIPVVLLDRDYLPYPKRSPHDLVGIDNRRTGFAATQHLLELGAERLVFLTYPEAAATIDERIAGCREALFMYGHPVDASLVQQLDPEEECGGIREMIESVQPDAFVCVNDRTAGRLMHCLMNIGISIPADVRIIGIDDTPYANLLPVPLTTMHIPCREIGMTAMATMLERIEWPDIIPRDVLLECSLVVRESCGAKTGSAASRASL